MSQPLLSEPFSITLAAVQRVLTHFSDQGLIIGGVAVSLLAAPRFTADVDALLLLNLDDLPELLAVARREGFIARVANLEEFARRSRIVLLQHEATEVNVDLSLGVLPFEVEAVERGQSYSAGAFEIRLPTAEDLVIQKAVAHRPKDLLDIASIVATFPRLDWQRIEYWVQQFADVLEMPELWQDVANLRPDAKRAKPNKRRGV